MPRGQSSRTSLARTSHRAPSPNVTTRPGATVAIHMTWGSSPLRIASPDAASARTMCDFSSRVFSSLGNVGWCSLPIDVTTVTSGRTRLA